MWALTLALLTCLSIDFANPLLPGVVRFEDREGVDALRGGRSRANGGEAAPALRPAPGGGPADLLIAPPRTSVAAAERPRAVPAAVRPRGLPAARGIPPAPAPAAGEDD